MAAKAIRAVMSALMVAATLPSCVHLSCQTRDELAEQCACGDGEVRRNPGGVGVQAAVDFIGGSNIAGARSTAGLAVRGGSYSAILGMGAVTNLTEDSWGMALTSGVRADWGWSESVFPRITAGFANFTEHWGNNSWRPRWLLTGEFGVDWVPARFDAMEIAISPMLSVGMEQWDVGVADGARLDSRTNQAFDGGAGVGVGVLLW